MLLALGRPTYGAYGSDGATSSEDGQATKQRLSVLAQQAVAPGHNVAHGPLTGR